LWSVKFQNAGLSVDVVWFGCWKLLKTKENDVPGIKCWIPLCVWDVFSFSLVDWCQHSYMSTNLQCQIREDYNPIIKCYQ
jgi:hypothetical protein